MEIFQPIIPRVVGQKCIEGSVHHIEMCPSGRSKLVITG